MDYNIGIGVKNSIAEAGDEARSDEVYGNQPQGHKVSVTYGRDAIYYYYQEDNRVNRLPFD